MNKIKEIKYPRGRVQYLYFCWGCGYEHAFELDVHTWNGDFENPTISPSLFERNDPQRICHSFIKDGYIQYLNDCHHKLAGKTLYLAEEDSWNALKSMKKAKQD